MILEIWVFSCFIASIVSGCNKINNCACSKPEGIIDVSSLGSTSGTPMFPSILGPDQFWYSLNLCYPFNEGSCTAASACQTSADFLNNYQLGDASPASFFTQSGDNTVHVIYKSLTDVERTTDVALICDESKTTPEVKALGELSYLNYAFEVRSVCACPNGCGSPIEPTAKPEAGGMSTGSILCIIFFVLLAVYLIAGVLFQRYRRQARGKDLIPNKDFWTAIPGLVKEGAVFSYTKVRSTAKRDSTYQSI